MIAPAHNQRLGDLCSVIDCEHKTAPTQENGIPLIRTPNIGKGRLVFDGVQRISEDIYRKWSRRGEPLPGDLIMAREAPVGNVALIGVGERVCLGQRTVLLRRNSSTVDTTYLSCLLNSPTVSAYINLLTNGATVGHLNVSDIRKLALPSLPSLATQRKIAAVLAAYDDLIEANRRQITLLERMAEEIYREWFVRLRFPGHAKSKITKGLPAGWEILPFSAVVTIDPVERIDKEEERPFAAMDDLSESSMYFTPSVRRSGNVGPKFRNGDVLFPRITPSVENGKRGLVLTLAEGEVAQGSTEFIVIREKIITSEHIYFLSCSEGFRTNAELSMTGASGRQRVQDQCFDNFLVNVPPEPLRQHFTEVVRPMVQQIRLLSRQSEHLQRTRDLLLPRLISGKLPVEDLAIAFPPSMAVNS